MLHLVHQLTPHLCVVWCWEVAHMSLEITENSFLLLAFGSALVIVFSEFVTVSNPCHIHC